MCHHHGNSAWHLLSSLPTQGALSCGGPIRAFEMNMGVRLGKGPGGALESGGEGKGRGELLQVPGGRQPCFPARGPEPEAHRKNSGWSPLSKCDGHFSSQIAFSSLAHARAPLPLLVIKLTPQLSGASPWNHNYNPLNCS